ncbi:MAG: acylphosphatase [Acidobacteria bacterium]|nr:acylphosphatase [Acidobacteriota bacterium]
MAKKFIVAGRVQGVGFRFFTERVADQLGLRGYVKNLWNGNVEAYAVGEEAQLEEFKRRLAEGPRMARVESVHESDEPVDKTYRAFLIE